MSSRSVDFAEGVTGLERGVRRMERWAALDEPANLLGRLARPIAEGRAGPFLKGAWQGHALHPPLTDVALGCWLGAGFLDLMTGKKGKGAATTLVGVGLIAAGPTVLSGAAEWPSLTDRSTRRVAVVHATGNAAVVLCYLTSWLLRRSGRSKAGVAWGLAGGGLGLVTGYLGGHLAFGRGVGMGERWASDPDPSGSDNQANRYYQKESENQL